MVNLSLVRPRFDLRMTVLMHHLGDYKPPGCQFNHVVMTFTATSFGRQFDR